MLCKKFLLPMLVLSTAIFIVSCAKDNYSSYDQNNNFPLYSTPITDDLKSVLANAPLICSDGNCPENIGMIGIIVAKDIYRGKNSVGQCTGFLIAKNIVATNAHCVEGLPSTQSDCSGVLAIKFAPSNAEPTNTFSCKRLIKKFGPSSKSDGPDYAFFEIEPSVRNPVNVAKTGIADRLPVRVTKVDPYNGSLGGTIVTTRCSTVQNSLLNFSYTSEWSETALAVGCQGNHGNSGSPVFNDLSNEVLGILQSRKTESLIAQIKRKMGSLITEIPSDPPPHFVFTNLSCIQNADIGLSGNQALCEETLKNNDTSFPQGKKIREANQEILTKKITSWSERLPKIALYSLSLKKDAQLTVNAFPTCLRPQTDWPREVLEQSETSGLFWRKTKYKAIYESSLILELKLKLDNNFRMETNLDLQDRTVNYQLEVTLTGKDGAIEAYIRPMHSFMSSIVLPLKKLHWCTKEEITAGNTMAP